MAHTDFVRRQLHSEPQAILDLVAGGGGGGYCNLMVADFATAMPQSGRQAQGCSSPDREALGTAAGCTADRRNVEWLRHDFMERIVRSGRHDRRSGPRLAQETLSSLAQSDVRDISRNRLEVPLDTVAFGRFVSRAPRYLVNSSAPHNPTLNTMGGGPNASPRQG